LQTGSRNTHAAEQPWPRKIRTAVTAIAGSMTVTWAANEAKIFAKVPLPTPEGVRSVLDELAERNPKAKDQDPAKFFDDRFVRQLNTSGFIDSLYR
jgi:hypothetical protein